MKNTNPYKQIWLSVGGALTGLTISVVLIYFVKGELDLSIFLGGLTGMAIFVAFNLLRLKRKKDATPEFDERIKENLNKFRTVVGSIFLALIAITLIVLFILEINSINTAYIWMALFLYIFIIGFGSTIVKSR